MYLGSNDFSPAPRAAVTLGRLAPALPFAAMLAVTPILIVALGHVGLLLILLGLGSWFAAQLARHRRAARRDIKRLLSSIDRIGQGDFAFGSADTYGPGFDELFDAVAAMAQRVKHTIDGLHEVAQRDTLTSLHNRSSFERAVERQLKKEGGDGAVLFIDLDGFKSVNDMLGHNLGDRLLQVASDRLKLACRLDELFAVETASADRLELVTIARFGGDEFVVFLSGVASEAVARKVAARILRVIGEPFELGPRVASVGASVGIALAHTHGKTYADLLRAADAAMYHAKRSGRNRVEVYSTALDEEVLRLAEQEQELREALVRGEFELFFQPLIDCRTLRVSSAEALLRWRHPKRGLVLPGEFIPLAERANLIGAIGEWVVGEAARRIFKFAAAGQPLRIAVNVSPNQLQTVEFIAIVKAALQRAGAPAYLLELEITEDVAMRDVDLAADRLARLARLGVSVALDDFGTGYSNLASLIDMPFSRLKLDRSLVQNLTLRSEARVLAQTIISMANSLGLHSVAEGVETQDQLELLTAMGCDEVQGFLLSQPISHRELEELLAEPDMRIRVNSAPSRAA